MPRTFNNRHVTSENKIKLAGSRAPASPSRVVSFSARPSRVGETGAEADTTTGAWAYQAGARTELAGRRRGLLRVCLERWRPSPQENSCAH